MLDKKLLYIYIRDLNFFLGLMVVLVYVRLNNDLGYLLCNNLREGNWLLDYVVKRL